MSVAKLCEEIDAALAAAPAHAVHQDTRAGWCAALIEHIRKRAIAKGKKDLPGALTAARSMIALCAALPPPPSHAGPSGYSPAAVPATLRALLEIAYVQCDAASSDVLAYGLKSVKASIAKGVETLASSTYAEDVAYREELSAALKHCTIPRRPKS
jgi:hypothetical protein